MSVEYAVGLLLCAALLGYLAFALIRPDKF
jgi:K+-transporting ATPase KdpF subunit